MRASTNKKNQPATNPPQKTKTKKPALWISTALPPGPLHWRLFVHGYIIRAWRRYFRYSLAFETPLDGAAHYVMAEYPHGVFPLSQMLAATLPTAWPAGMRIYSIAADIVFAVPLWRQIMTWVGARPATAENFKALLGLGSVALVPGE